jgi:hypothetical protein
MKLKRPYIPIDVRLEVIFRQLLGTGSFDGLIYPGVRKTLMDPHTTKAEKLRRLLFIKFGSMPFHLDHDPPLVLRPFSERTGRYKPDANDPNHLLYRDAEDHRVKTFIRGDGAQLSDAGKRRKEIKRKRKATGEPTSRPLQSANRWPPRGSRPLQSRRK